MATKKVLITEVDGSENYSEVVAAENAVAVDGTQQPGYVPISQSDGSVTWFQNSGVKILTEHPSNYTEVYINEDTGEMYRIV